MAPHRAAHAMHFGHAQTDTHPTHGPAQATPQPPTHPAAQPAEQSTLHWNPTMLPLFFFPQ